MLKNYIINESTLYLEQQEQDVLINDLSTFLTIPNMKLKKIIEESCLYYGCSYRGHLAGTKSLINENYKLPIIINPHKKIVIFPLTALSNSQSIWFNFSNIENYHQISKSKVLVEFKGGISRIFHVSYFIFHNQILRCSRLLVIFNNRNNY